MLLYKKVPFTVPSASKFRDALVFISLNKCCPFKNRFHSNVKWAVAQHLVTQPQASRASHEADYLCNSLNQHCILLKTSRAWSWHMRLADFSAFSFRICPFFWVNIHIEEGAESVGKRERIVGYVVGNPSLLVSFFFKQMSSPLFVPVNWDKVFSLKVTSVSYWIWW